MSAPIPRHKIQPWRQGHCLVYRCHSAEVTLDDQESATPPSPGPGLVAASEPVHNHQTTMRDEPEARARTRSCANLSRAIVV